MLSRVSPTLRTSLPRHQLASIAALPISRFPSRSPTQSSFQQRSVANKVANQPGSSSFEHAAQNLREEVGAIAGEVGKGIKGSKDNTPGEESTDFIAITKDMVAAVPAPAMIWGLAGTVPYALTAVATGWTARNATMMVASGADHPSLELLQSLQSFQITYGAVILSFLGAIHWGMEFGKVGGEQGHKRLALGVLPLGLAWPTLYMADPTLALVAQWGAFLVSWTADRWATNQGWTPRWYSTYRFYLTAVAGGSLILSLAAMNHYDPQDPKLKGGPGTQVGFKEQVGRSITMSPNELKEEGLGVSTSPDQDSFTVISKVETPEQERERINKKGEMADKQRKKDDAQFMNSPPGFKESKPVSAEKGHQAGLERERAKDGK